MNTSFEPKSQAPTQHNSKRENQNSKAYPSRTIVHAKLEMTEPGDHDEQEADAVANIIVSGGKIARKISGGGGSSGIAVSQQMESQLSQLQGGGRQMPEGLRNMMESGFGQDFSQVRLHTDSEAASMSNSIHAKAFTHGNDIYFNHGQFAPETSEGQHLVAHELTHVVQRTGKIGREDAEPKFIYHNGLTTITDDNYSEMVYLDVAQDIEEMKMREDIENVLAGTGNLYDLYLHAIRLAEIADQRKTMNYQNSITKDYFDPRKRDFSASSLVVNPSYYALEAKKDLYPKDFNRNVHLVIGHGTPDSIRYEGMEYYSYDNEDLEELANKLNIKNHEIIVFNSCNLGNGQNSFAQIFSKYLKNKKSINNIIIAADGKVLGEGIEIKNRNHPTAVQHTANYCVDNGTSQNTKQFIAFRNGQRIDNKTLFGRENGPKCIYGSNSVFSHLSDIEQYEESQRRHHRQERKDSEKTVKIVLQELKKMHEAI